jgi:uracil-DNA glycosylase
MKGQIFSPFVLEQSWNEKLKSELCEPYLIHLAAFIESEYAMSTAPIYPPKDLIFNAFSRTPFEKVKVVIMGQDPYHGAGQAHGLSFSVPHGTKAPPSLQNIFKELEADLGCPKPSHGCLLSWADQGVLLLNATLTVREGDPMSHHGRGWEKFTDAVIRTLAEEKEYVIFVLWGKSAQDKCRFLQGDVQLNRHSILTAAHPSPLSAHNGFLGCRHFSMINDLLEKRGEKPIDWSLYAEKAGF